MKIPTYPASLFFRKDAVTHQMRYGTRIGMCCFPVQDNTSGQIFSNIYMIGQLAFFCRFYIHFPDKGGISKYFVGKSFQPLLVNTFYFQQLFRMA